MRSKANVQSYTCNFTAGDRGIPRLGNYNNTQNNPVNTAAIAEETAIFSFSNIGLHSEAFQFRTKDYYDVMNKLLESENYSYHFKKCILYTDSVKYNGVLTPIFIPVAIPLIFKLILQ